MAHIDENGDMRLDHTAQQIDDAVAATEPGGYIPTQLAKKADDLGNLTQAVVDDATYPHPYFGSTIDIAGLPSGGQYRVIYVPYFSNAEGYSVQIAIGAVGNDGLHWRKSWGKEWKQWNTAPTATPPQELALPLATGYIKAGLYACDYSKAQDGTALVHIAIEHVSGTLPTGGRQVATLPLGYRPKATVGQSYGDDGVYVNPDGAVIYIISAPCTRLVETLEFRTTSDTNASSQVRMAVPTTKKARSAIPKEPETRLMCVVDAAGNYVELVQVTITYDEGWETKGALFTTYCYTMQDGETLVDSPQPPPTRRHAGGAGLVQPVWDFKGKAWVETATAEELAAWELEHPAPEPAGPTELQLAQQSITDLELNDIEQGQATTDLELLLLATRGGTADV